jgi:hypothetical protein
MISYLYFNNKYVFKNKSMIKYSIKNIAYVYNCAYKNKNTDSTSCLPCDLQMNEWGYS